MPHKTNGGKTWSQSRHDLEQLGNNICFYLSMGMRPPEIMSRTPCGSRARFYRALRVATETYGYVKRNPLVNLRRRPDDDSLPDDDATEDPLFL